MSQSHASEIDQQLSAFFDGELEEARLAEDIEHDPELASKLADLEFMRTIVVGALERQAERVPEARFEQIWDNFERTLERESRLQEAAEDPPHWWQRLLAWARPLRVPLATVAAAGVLALVFARSIDTPDGGESQAENSVEQPASEQPPTEPQPSVSPPSLSPIDEPPSRGSEVPQIAVAPDEISPRPGEQPELEDFPQPEPGEAEIKRIEFGGRSATISQIEGSRGTTTVIWVTEDEEPVDSERSL